MRKTDCAEKEKFSTGMLWSPQGREIMLLPSLGDSGTRAFYINLRRVHPGDLNFLAYNMYYGRYQNGKFTRTRRAGRSYKKRKDYAFQKAKRAAKSVLWKNAESKKKVDAHVIGLPTGVTWRIHLHNPFAGMVMGSGQDDLTGVEIHSRLLKLDIQLYQWGGSIVAPTFVEIALIATKDLHSEGTIVDNTGSFPSVGMANWWDGRVTTGSNPALPFNLWTYNSRNVKVLKKKRYNMKTQSDGALYKRDMRTSRFKYALKGRKVFEGLNPDLLGNALRGYQYYVVTRIHKPGGSGTEDNFEISYSSSLYYKDF